MYSAAEPAWNPLSFLDTELSDKAEHVDDTTCAYLIFKLQGQWLAANVSHIREILDDQPFTPLPNAPHDVEGMIDVRGKGIAVVDLAQHLGIRAHSDAVPERIVVLEFDRPGLEPLAIGVRTEAVRDVCQISAHDIEDTPEALRDWDQSMISGVARIEGRLVILIELSSVIGASADDADMFAFG